MPSYPNRCQHLKINGTQCGSPALRRNRFCYFHKRHHEEQIELNADRLRDDRRRRRKVALELPVLEDANSIQVALMQIMRLLLAGQIEGKTAGLLLFALQTASANLRHTNFEPLRHSVVLDPAAVSATPLGADLWEDSDFIPENDQDEEPENIRRLKAKYGVPPDAAPSRPKRASAKAATAHTAPKRPPTGVREVREKIGEMIEEAVPGLIAAHEAIQKANQSG